MREMLTTKRLLLYWVVLWVFCKEAYFWTWHRVSGLNKTLFINTPQIQKMYNGKIKWKGLFYKAWSSHKLDVKISSFQQLIVCKRSVVIMERVSWKGKSQKVPRPTITAQFKMEVACIHYNVIEFLEIPWWRKVTKMKKRRS